MALPAAGVLEVRSTGSNTNSGGFVAGGAGTDWSRQNSPQYSVTDGVADGTTTLTSATAAFGTDVVDNYVYVSGGTGSITAGWYRIVSRTSATAIVVDRSTGLTAGTGVTLHIGGALASLATAAAIVVPGNTVWIKKTAGYTTAAAVTLAVDATDGNPIAYIGYDADRGDNEQATITSTNAAATQVIEVTGAGSILRNLAVDGGGVSARGIRANDYGVTLDGCEGKTCTQHGIYVTSSALKAMVKRCRATGNGSGGTHSGFACEGEVGTFDRCESRGNDGYGFYGILGTPRWINCIGSGNTLDGFYIGGNNDTVEMIQCTAYGNTRDGLRADSASLFGGLVRGNVFAANGGYGVRSPTTDYSANVNLAILFEANGFWSNTLGARFQMPTGETDVTLTLDPFTDAANRDFSLNLTEGGGLDLRGVGVPGEIGLRSDPAASVGFNDIGAVPAGGSASTSSSLGQMRTLWRELTGEFDTTVIPNAVVDLYLNRGLEWLNQATEYHMTTDDGGVALVAGTQEYTLDEAVMRVKWVQLAGQELERGDIEEWRNRGEAWRGEVGMPTQWAVEGNRIIFRPTPNAAAVAVASAPVMRYVSAPPDIATAGPEQLQRQDWPLSVYWAAQLYSATEGGTDLAQGRSQALVDMAQKQGVFSQRDSQSKDTRR